MKPRYVIRIGEKAVLVEHRARLRWQTLALGTGGFVVFCFLSGAGEEAIHSSVEWAWMVGILLLMYVPIMTLLSAYPLYARAEVLQCDAGEFRLARRRLFRRWTRVRLNTQAVENLRLVQHIGRDRRHYSAIAFVSSGKRYEMLEYISDGDADRVLAGCEALGARRFLEPEDTASVAMREDIARRGWWVKPWTKD